MPQLIVDPWFYILISSWVLFLTVIPSKVMKHYFNGEPGAASTSKTKANAWDWTWH